MMHILTFKLDFDCTGYLDDVHLLIKLGQAALVIFIIFAIISILLIIIICCCITITKTKEQTLTTPRPPTTMPFAGYNMTSRDSCSSSVSVTNERQMTRNKRRRRRSTEDEASNCRDRDGRRFPGTTVTPQVIFYHYLLVHNLYYF